MIRSQLLLKIGLTATMISLLLALTSGFESDNSLFMIRTCLILAFILSLGISFLSPQFRKIASYFIGLIVAIPIGAKAIYQEFTIEWSVLTVFIFFLGSSIPLLVQLKTKVMIRLLNNDRASFETGILLVITGVFSVISLFLSGTFGLVLLASGLFVTALAQVSFRYIQHAILLFAAAWIIFSVYELELSTDLILQGSFWLGLLVGIGSILIGKSLIISEKRRFNLSLILPISIISILILPGFIHESFGGINTLIGAILGSAISVALIVDNMESRIFSGAFIPLILIGVTFQVNTLFLPEKLKVESLITSEQSNTPKTEKSDPMILPAHIPNDTHDGVWKSLKDNSKLTFEIGPKSGRTSGAIRDFDVELQLSNGKPQSLEVTMQTTSLTTFNGMRDDEVLGSSFIQSENYPTALYKSTSIQQVGENFEVEGTLNFVGQTVQVPLIIRFISQVQKAGKEVFIFVGNAQVDRTKHAMKSDAKIGDLVDISFEIAIEKR